MECAGTEKVALVVGSTGIIGAVLVNLLLLQHPEIPVGPCKKVYALSRRPLPPWYAAAASSFSSSNNDPNATVVHLHVDLADDAAVTKALAPLTDITHIFYVTWAPRQGWSNAEARAVNRAMLSSVLSAVVPNAPDLKHVALQSGRNQSADPFQPPVRGAFAEDGWLGPYSEDLPRPDYPDLEDALIDGIASRVGDVTWSVHRPATILGFSPRSSRNLVSSLCVYAAICGKEGAVLRWPGSLVAWEGFSDACDSWLVAVQAIWAAMMARPNEAFNCGNGDVFKWKQLWPMLASYFGVPWAGYEGEDQRFKLEEAMVGKEPVWAEIIEENGLVETELDDITTWWLVDAVINADKEHVETMNKSKEFGFHSLYDTVRCFDTCIRRLKASRIVP
jgi:nucleoside-diphosphate-sugar epimerase